MALAALITAVREAREPGVALRATFPLAGLTLVERQARMALEAGARRLIILIESLPAELAAAIERLRRAGQDVVTARSAGEAQAATEGFDRLLLIADGLLADSNHVDQVARRSRPGVLTVPDSAFDERFERIDRECRWGGLAVVDAGLLREAAAMPPEWDTQSTLLRRALQIGVRTVPLDGDPLSAELTIVERREDVAQLQRRILASSAPDASNWLSRLILGPIERMVTGALMTTAVTPLMIGIAAAVLSLLGALAFTQGWLWLGLLPLLLATPLEGVAGRLARLRLQVDNSAFWWRLLLPLCAGVALLALGRYQALGFGWGMILLAAMSVAFLIALPHELEDRPVPLEILLADRKSLIWLMLPFAVAGAWAAGMVFLFAYAAGSFFWAQYHAHRPAQEVLELSRGNGEPPVAG